MVWPPPFSSLLPTLTGGEGTRKKVQEREFCEKSVVFNKMVPPVQEFFAADGPSSLLGQLSRLSQLGQLSRLGQLTPLSGLPVSRFPESLRPGY